MTDKYTIERNDRGSLANVNWLARACAPLVRYTVVEPSAGVESRRSSLYLARFDIALGMMYGSKHIVLTIFKLFLLKTLMETEGAWCARRALRKVL